MNILGSNFLLSNKVNGVADPSVGYVNSASLADVQSRVHSDGALYQLNNGHGGDTFTFNSGNGNALFATDADDTITLHGNWKNAEQYVQDQQTGIWGKLFTNDKGEKAVISGPAEVKVDNDKQPGYMGVTKEKVNSGITAIEDGKNVDGLVTKDEIDAAIKNNKFSGNEKAFWQNVSDNFDSFDTDKDGRKGGDHLLNAADVIDHGSVNS